MKKLLRKLELALRFGIVYPAFRLLFRNPVRRGRLRLSDARKILILRYDRIGDIIVTTPVISALKKAAPHVRIGVFASESNSSLIRGNSCVERVHVLSSNPFMLAREVLHARREGYDVVLNFIFNRTTSGGVLANLSAPRGFKVGQGADHYQFYFNRLLKLDRGRKHMVEVLFDYVEEVFGETLDRSLPMQIDLSDDDRRKAETFLGSSGKPFAVVNISATDDDRKVSIEQAEAILRCLGDDVRVPVIVISSPDQNDVRDRLAAEAKSQDVRAFPGNGETATLREIAAIVAQARFVISPDTSVIHIASAMKTPVIGLYTPKQMSAEWQPYGIPHRSILSEEGQPVRAIAMPLIRQTIREFGSEVMAS